MLLNGAEPLVLLLISSVIRDSVSDKVTHSTTSFPAFRSIRIDQRAYNLVALSIGRWECIQRRLGRHVMHMASALQRILEGLFWGVLGGLNCSD